MSWAASKAVGQRARRRALRALLNDSELFACSIHRILLAEVCANLLQFEPDGRYRVTAGPEMLAREVALLAAQPGDADCALPFQKPDHGRNRMLRGNRDTHVHMVRHKVTLNDLTLLLPSQRVEDCTQLSTCLAEDDFPSSLGHEHNMVLAVPF